MRPQHVLVGPPLQRSGLPHFPGQIYVCDFVSVQAGLVLGAPKVTLVFGSWMLWWRDGDRANAISVCARKATGELPLRFVRIRLPSLIPGYALPQFQN
jgi:hypothetical protein